MVRNRLSLLLIERAGFCFSWFSCPRPLINLLRQGAKRLTRRKEFAKRKIEFTNEIEERKGGKNLESDNQLRVEKWILPSFFSGLGPCIIVPLHVEYRVKSSHKWDMYISQSAFAFFLIIWKISYSRYIISKSLPRSDLANRTPFLSGT